MDPCDPTQSNLQKLEEKAAKAQEAFEKEEKLRKEVEALNSKLLQEKQELLSSLEGEKGSLSDFQEKTNKLQAQKADLESQLHVSTNHFYTLIFDKFYAYSFIYKSYEFHPFNTFSNKLFKILFIFQVIIVYFRPLYINTVHIF